MDFNLPELTPETPGGVLCQVKVGDLKPLQNAVGFDEVNDKIARYSAKSKEELKDYLLLHPVPVVIGNGGHFYLSDHHHMANALWKTAEGKNKAGIDTNNARVVAVVHQGQATRRGHPDQRPPPEHQKDIIDEAMHLARSPEAAGMPGYLGRG